MKAPPDPEIRAARMQALVEMLHSDGWRQVARPALHERCGEIARQLALAQHAPLERLRELQAEYAVLARLLEKPKRFLLLGGHAEEADAALET